MGSFAVNPGCARAGNKQRDGQYPTHCELAAAVEKHCAIGDDEKNTEDTDQRSKHSKPRTKNPHLISFRTKWHKGQLGLVVLL